MATRTGERNRSPRPDATSSGSTARPAAKATRPTPTRSSDFEHLTLDSLRTYRQSLNEEESRVSYWRRLIQARLDLLREAAGEPWGDRLESRADTLRSAFSEVRHTTRTAHVRVAPPDDSPPLPDLQSLWTREIVPGDPAEAAALGRDLAGAEMELSAYRAALHRRITKATDELIARYRENPALCLVALPLRPRG